MKRELEEDLEDERQQAVAAVVLCMWSLSRHSTRTVTLSARRVIVVLVNKHCLFS